MPGIDAAQTVIDDRLPGNGVVVIDPVQHARVFFEAHPEIDVLEAFIVDVNGQLRGKWVPVRSADKVMKGQLRFPCSSFSLDIWGNEVAASGIGAATGDYDGVCFPVPETLGCVTWSERPMAQVLLSMNDRDGTPFFADPRHALARVIDRYAARGWCPVVASELEFHLIDRELDEGRPVPPRSPASDRRLSARAVYSVTELEEFEAVFVDMAGTLETQGIPADTSVSEYGVGQYEINLRHMPDALLAADHSLLMKRAVKGVARKHSLDATFMAKPFPQDSGNGLHVHFSILDENGRNLFAAEDGKGARCLRYAMGGLLATMNEAMAIFSVNANSFRRFEEGAFAPTTATWGWDNRNTALRVPDSDQAGTRIEHRVAGADAEPHLVIAAVLAGALHGIENAIDPGEPVDGNAVPDDAPRLPVSWDWALDAFEESDFIGEFFGKRYRKVFTATKRQEKQKFEANITTLEYETYLRNI